MMISRTSRSYLTSASSRGRARPRKTATDFVIIIAMALGLTLTSLTIEGSRSAIYDLPGWLQAVQPVARPGAMAFFLVALIRYLQVAKVFSFRYLTGPAWVAWIINLFLLIKIYILGGNLEFFSQAIVLAFIQISLLLICLGGDQRKFGNGNPEGSVLSNFEASVFLFAMMFTALNLTLLIVAPQAVSTWFGRFYGTTANPQHTMMICVLCIPVCALVLRGTGRKAHERILAGLTLIGLGAIIYVTGSRTGFVGGLIVLALCFVDRFIGHRIVTTVFALFSATVITLLLFGERIWKTILRGVQGQYIDGREDTRTHVWRREFNDFVEHWQFGVPLEEHGRLYFSETYWMSIPSNGGVIGLALVLLLLVLMLFTCLRLFRAALQDESPLRYRIYAASCIAILILSMVESILAGIIVAHTMLATGYLAIAWNITTPRRSRRSVKRIPVIQITPRPQRGLSPLTP